MFVPPVHSGIIQAGKIYVAANIVMEKIVILNMRDVVCVKESPVELKTLIP